MVMTLTEAITFLAAEMVVVFEERPIKLALSYAHRFSLKKIFRIAQSLSLSFFDYIDFAKLFSQVLSSCLLLCLLLVQ